jgi:RND superfamily putative drug exporter
MKLLGDRNWYLPNWLNWLPKLGHHTETGLEPVPAAA